MPARETRVADIFKHFSYLNFIKITQKYDVQYLIIKQITIFLMFSCVITCTYIGFKNMNNTF